MNKISRKLWGLILIGIGIILLLNALEITRINIFFNGWWTLLIIIPCFIDLFNSNKEGKTGDIIGLVIGIILLLLMQGILNIELILKLFIPVIFLVIGLYLLFGNIIKNEVNSKIKNLSNNETENLCAIFSSQNIVKKEEFKKLNLDAVFGSLTLDLRKSEIHDEVLINASAIFGKIKIIVPKNVIIKTRSIPIFGFINNYWKGKDLEKIIYIKSFAMLGSVDIDE